MSALVLGLRLGPRLGHCGYEIDPSTRISPADVNLCNRALGGDTIFQMQGTMILWFAWYAFNGGSALAITGSNASLVGRVCITTTLCACASAIVGMILSFRKNHTIQPSYVSDTLLGGLVAITSFPHAVSYFEAILV